MSPVTLDIPVFFQFASGSTERKAQVNVTPVPKILVVETRKRVVSSLKRESRSRNLYFAMARLMDP